MDISGIVVREGLDDILDRITNDLLKYIPIKVVPAFLSWFSWSFNLSNVVFIQVKKISSAIVETFQEESIYFLKDSNNLGIKSKSVLSQVEVSNEWEWMYLPHKSVFVQKGYATVAPSKGAWFSAELFCKDLMISDLTEWLEVIRFHKNGDEMPPADVLVQAWCVSHERTLGSLDQYTLHIINDLMEEQTLPLRQSKVD